MRKKIILVSAVCGLFALLHACGPSEEEIRAREQARQDSIARVEREKARQDSIERARQDSIARAQAAEKARQDSIARADSIAKAEEAKKGKAKPKTKELKQKEEAKSVIKGRG